MRITVTGSGTQKIRKWNLPAVGATLEAVHKETPITMVLLPPDNGYAYVASVWAFEKGIFQKIFNKRFGYSVMNLKILKWKPSLVLAFPGEESTRDMVQKARARNIKVLEIQV